MKEAEIGKIVPKKEKKILKKTKKKKDSKPNLISIELRAKLEFGTNNLFETVEQIFFNGKVYLAIAACDNQIHLYEMLFDPLSKLGYAECFFGSI